MFGSLAEKLFSQSNYALYALIVSLGQAFVVSVLEGLVLAAHTKSIIQIAGIKDKVGLDLMEEYDDIYALGRSMTVYNVLFIVSQFFQLGLCIDALYHQNTIQLIALSLFIFGCFIISTIQVYQSTSLISEDGGVQKIIRDNITALPRDAVPYEGAIIAVLFITSISFAYLAYKLYQEFGWSIYKKIGADMAMRDRYKLYQIFIMLLKFGVFFYLGFSLQFLALVVILAEPDREIIKHVILSVLTSIGMIIGGFVGVKTERKILMYLFMVGICVIEGYIMWKIVDVTRNENDKFRGTKNSVSLFLYTCAILGVVTFIISFLCLRNFDKGLKFHLSRSKSLTSQVNRPEEENNHTFNLENVNRQTQRWSID